MANEKCVCGHPESSHTPLWGCIEGLRHTMVRCGCRQFRKVSAGTKRGCAESPSVARAQSSGYAAVRPETQTAGATAGSRGFLDLFEFVRTGQKAQAAADREIRKATKK